MKNKLSSPQYAIIAIIKQFIGYELISKRHKEGSI